MKKYLLILILIVAASLRLWNLGGVPPSTSNDEASIGYNAYSVSKIGVDEYGKFPLISQRAYDDWRRSTYLLLVVPFVSLFGLHSISIRLPSIILSICTVFATYHIVVLLFTKRSHLAEITALVASLLLAISPWHVYISRIGHETNAYMSFFVFGMLSFLMGLRVGKKLFLSVLFFTLSMISYYAGQVIVPLTGIGLFIIYRNYITKLLSTNKKVLFGFIACCFLLIPITWSLFSPESLVRFHGTSTFDPSAHGQEFTQQVIQFNQAAARKDIFGMIRYNRRMFPIRVFIDGYLSHFSPKWLFTNSGKESFKIPRMGLLNIWEIPLIFLGMIAFIVSMDVDRKKKALLFLWFSLAAIPASIATQAPHAMRAYAFLPVWQIFAAFGFTSVGQKLGKFKGIWIALLLFFVVSTMRSFSINYFSLFPYEQSQSFYYAMSRAVPYVSSISSQYDKIIFSNQSNLYQSYMDYLYYSKFDPKIYQMLGGTKSGGFAETHTIGKYEFRPIDWKNEKRLARTLYIGNVSDFPVDIRVKMSFLSLDNSPTVLVVDDVK